MIIKPNKRQCLQKATEKQDVGESKPESMTRVLVEPDTSY